ncbi:MAG: hypothetical protein JNL67_05350 [Planctomycetaceae bacterium]|nr:hypothetical protein [Planctomycetaceae bacterium]
MSENRANIIAKLVKVAKKQYPAVSPPAGRSVLENLLYACLLENAQFTAADEAFARLEQYSDWNEVRVTTNQELCEAAASLVDPLPAIEHLKQLLHSLFETHYSFDLDFLIKENQGKAVAQLEKYKGITPFVVAYLVQNSFGGHKIPTSGATLDLADALGLLTPKEKESGVVPGFERAVPKTKGPEFFSTVHQLAVDFKNKPRDKQVLACLKEINPEAVKRLEAADAAAKKAAKSSTEPPAVEKPVDAKHALGKKSGDGAKSSEAEKKPTLSGKPGAQDAKSHLTKSNEGKSPDAKTAAVKPVATKSPPSSAGSPNKSAPGGDKKQVATPPSGNKSTATSAKTTGNGPKPSVKPSPKQPEKPVAKPVAKKTEPTQPHKSGKPLKPMESASKKNAPASKATPPKKKPR